MIRSDRIDFEDAVIGMKDGLYGATIKDSFCSSINGYSANNQDDPIKIFKIITQIIFNGYMPFQEMSSSNQVVLSLHSLIVFDDEEYKPFLEHHSNYWLETEFTNIEIGSKWVTADTVEDLYEYFHINN